MVVGDDLAHEPIVIHIRIQRIVKTRLGGEFAVASRQSSAGSKQLDRVMYADALGAHSPVNGMATCLAGTRAAPRISNRVNQ
jgi:hypothetical protein